MSRTKKHVVVSRDGEILQEHIGLTPPAVDDSLLVVEVDLEFVPDGQWYSSGEFLPKVRLSLPGSLQIIANGIDEAIITNIPAGVAVEWPDGQIDEVTDGEVRFSVDLPGTYTLIFDAVPYLRQEVTIEAVTAA